MRKCIHERQERFPVSLSEKLSEKGILGLSPDHCGLTRSRAVLSHFTFSPKAFSSQGYRPVPSSHTQPRFLLLS